MLDLGVLKSDVIPYRKSRERFRIINQELAKGRVVEYDNQNVYSFARETKYNFTDGKSARTFENFKCLSCNNQFRVTATCDILWAVCSKCGGANIDKLTGEEEKEFENKIN